MSILRSKRAPAKPEQPAALFPVPPGFRASERRTPDRPCLNCGDPTPGNFCRTCGQRKVEVHVSLGRMLLEALDDQFSINSALPRTLGALIARPGHLTREYMSGRIARYIPPFRLYLVTSVLFFLALSLLPDLRNPQVNLGGPVSIGGPGITQGARPSRHVAPIAPVTRGQRPGVARPPVPPPPPATSSWLAGTVKTGNAVIDSVANERLDHFRRMEPKVAVRQVISGFLGRVPQMMFLLLPIFAGMLMILYAGSGRFYVEHFVFALHVHASAFLIYLGMIGLVRWPGAVSALLCWLLLYVYLAMKKVYGQGWIVTGMKYLVLGVAYVCLLTIGISLTLLATVFLA
jgi:hypothetical protein